MGIGLGIFFIAVGAILTFAVNADVSGIELSTVGIILMAVGAFSVLLDLIIFMPRRRRTVTTDESGRTVERDTTV